MSETPVNQEQAQTPAQPTPPELTLKDLHNLKAVLELATRRGAFVANELSTVGAVFDKLDTFLASVSDAQPK